MSPLEESRIARPRTRGRRPWSTPGGAPIAAAVVVSLEHVAWAPAAHHRIAPSTVLNGPYPAIFDPHQVSVHEYGNRVGVFRVMQVCDRFGIRATAAIDARLARRAPRIVEECVARRWEVIGHGDALSNIITDHMAPNEERTYLEGAISELVDIVGMRPRGWLNPEYSQSRNTLEMLAKMRLEYVCDFSNDEQPYKLPTSHGDILNVPVSIELDEVFAHRQRGVTMAAWRDSVLSTARELGSSTSVGSRLIVLNLHPYIIGQPFRIHYLEEVLKELAENPKVWFATLGEIVDSYLTGAVAGP